MSVSFQKSLADTSTTTQGYLAVLPATPVWKCLSHPFPQIYSSSNPPLHEYNWVVRSFQFHLAGTKSQTLDVVSLHTTLDAGQHGYTATQNSWKKPSWAAGRLGGRARFFYSSVLFLYRLAFDRKTTQRQSSLTLFCSNTTDTHNLQRVIQW
jgi:hypothetical protein